MHKTGQGLLHSSIHRLPLSEMMQHEGIPQTESKLRHVQVDQSQFILKGPSILARTDLYSITFNVEISKYLNLIYIIKSHIKMFKIANYCHLQDRAH